MNPLIRAVGGMLMRLLIFPNVVAVGVGLATAEATGSKVATVASMIVAFGIGYLIGRKLWP